MASKLKKRKIKRGRRPKTDTSTKDDLLKASLEVFSKNGLKNSSIREIANEAGVDSALIYHYFKTKEELFFETIKSKMQPPDRAEIKENENPNERAKRISKMFFERFNESENSSTFIALMRSALENEEAAGLMRQLFEEQLITHVSNQFDTESAHLRVSLSASLLLGLNFVRNILKLEPLNSMENEQIASLIAPILTPLLSRDFGSFKQIPL